MYNIYNKFTLQNDVVILFFVHVFNTDIPIDAPRMI